VASTIGFHTVVGTVLVFRAFACAGLALAAVSLCAISRRHGQRPAHVMALTLLSPLTLLHLVSAGHNDAIMLGLLAAGVALASAGRPMSGIALCTLAAAVKLPAAIAILFIVWGLVRDLPSLRARVATLARGGAVALGTIAATTAASGLSWGWLGALGVPGVAAPRLAAVNDFAFGFDHPLGLQFTTLLHLARDLGMVLAVVAIGYLLLHSRRAQGIPALGAALIVAAVLGPTFYPWYLTWGLMLVAAAAADRWERAILWANLVPTFAVAPGGEGWLDLAAKTAGTWIARSVVGAVVAAAAITIYRPRRVAALFRRAPDRLVQAAPPQLERVALTPSTDGSAGNGHVAPAAPHERDENEPAVS
jgi:hypothetical protein